MANSTAPTLLDATPDLQEIVALLLMPLRDLQQAVQSFRQQAPTPERTLEFELRTGIVVQEAGRVVVEHEFNRIEPDTVAECPERLRWAGEEYRRRPKSPNTIATSFGPIRLHRYLYEPLERGEKSIFPLELQLGIEAGLATPALADRVGRQSAERTQKQVRAWLLHEHGVSWSNKTLRKLQKSLSEGLASFREPAQAARLLKLLKAAARSRGPHQPVLAVGRDGIMVPLRKGVHEAATATVTVMDRRGTNLGTVYLGRMPQSGQGVLSDQLTSLLTQVLSGWHGPLPRLAYITDGGHHPQRYYEEVLKRMENPHQPGQRLQWQWIVDFWHACGYVAKLKEGLFGDAKAGWAWFKKMRHWLQRRNQGVTQVLRSASQLRNGCKRLSKARTELFEEAYHYLRGHTEWMDYARYRRLGMPIGSGVTEAACKIVFTQRLKQSGMRWQVEGGQVIADLRVLVLSDVWSETYRAYLQSRPLPEVVKTARYQRQEKEILKIAA